MGLLQEKNEGLRKLLAGYGRLAVAFSGGVDSSFLLAAAAEVLGDQVLAVTAAPVFVPQRELEEAEAFCRERGIRQVVLPAGELNIDGVRHNPPDRCYHCKKEIFSRIRRAASEEGFRILAEGSNLDDTGDYRPGMRAVRELGVVSPLLEAGLTKAEIRELSRQMSLPTWEKPSFACLASRFVYGEAITENKLHMVEQAEMGLHDLGFRQCRVRIHGMMARIELLPEDMDRFFEKRTRESVNHMLKDLGFKHVSVDLQGYRTGSMNE